MQLDQPLPPVTWTTLSTAHTRAFCFQPQTKEYVVSFSTSTPCILTVFATSRFIAALLFFNTQPVYERLQTHWWFPEKYLRNVFKYISIVEFFTQQIDIRFLQSCYQNLKHTYTFSIESNRMIEVMQEKSAMRLIEGTKRPYQDARRNEDMFLPFSFKNVINQVQNVCNL